MLLVAAAMAAVPISRGMVAAQTSCPEEVQFADAAARIIEIEWPLRGPGPDSDLLRRIGRDLTRAPELERVNWRFTLVDSGMPGAFAVGDGRIYVTVGTLAVAATEDEVAAVLAHEIAHQVGGHFCARDAGRAGGAPRFSLGSLMLAVDSEREREADARSLTILRAAGYDPGAALTAAERFSVAGKDRAIHRIDDQRLRALREQMDVGPPQPARASRADFERAKKAIAERATTEPR